MIRFAKPDDCAAMLAIYAPYIETTITFEQEVPSREAFSLRIADVQRDGMVRRILIHEFQRPVDRQVGRIAFGAGRQVNRRLGQRDAGFRHTDLVHRFETGSSPPASIRAR